MSLEEGLREINIDNIHNIFIFASILLFISFVQIFKPAFSLSYYLNSKPSYLKAKLISGFIASAALYIWGAYYYFFVDLAERSLYIFGKIWVAIFLYHGCIWGFTKFFDLKDKSS